VLVFSDPEIIRLAREEFVPVTGDDWYQRRREDAEGKFFRNVADQAGKTGPGGSTRQGIYCFTAGGKFLAYRNHHDPQVMRQVLQQGLTRFRNLPEAERKPGAIQVPDAGKSDTRYNRTPPPGGLIVKVYTRILDRTAKGEFCKGTCSSRGGDQAARDHLWLTEAESKSLVPANLKQGDRFPLPPTIVERIARFHLIDNTRGEPPMWRREDVRTRDVSLTAQEVNETSVRLRLEGSILLANQADPAQANRGFDARLLGYIEYDQRKKLITRFEMVALGEHWGAGTYTPGARPGRTPLGVAFELSRGTSSADQVPPQAAREIQQYLGRGQ
jgi:hypothetical protein